MHYMLTDCSSLFFKGYLTIVNQLEQKNIPGVQKLPAQYQSGITGFHSKIPRSSQYFQVVNQIFIWIVVYSNSNFQIAAKLELDIKSFFEIETHSCIYACQGSKWTCIQYLRNSISCSPNTIFGRFQTFLLGIPGLNLLQIANCLNQGDGFLWRFVAIISVCLNVILAFAWRE